MIGTGLASIEVCHKNYLIEQIGILAILNKITMDSPHVLVYNSRKVYINLSI